jgi:SET domain-containing protein
MLIVKTYLAPAGEKGIGLFAAEPIPKGAIWWKDDQTFNRIFSPEEVSNAPEIVRNFMFHYATLKSNGSWYLYVDNARFVNHSDTPNTIQANGGSRDVEGDWIALKDIAVGEEITSNYNQFCETCKDGLAFENKEDR